VSRVRALILAIIGVYSILTAFLDRFYAAFGRIPTRLVERSISLLATFDYRRFLRLPLGLLIL
jgi:hypothetical protein